MSERMSDERLAEFTCMQHDQVLDDPGDSFASELLCALQAERTALTEANARAERAEKALDAACEAFVRLRGNHLLSKPGDAETLARNFIAQAERSDHEDV